MSSEIVNQTMLPGNICFGCGEHNPDGLGIEIRRAEDGERLVAVFEPTENQIGFPGITHGGIVYAALDCIAAWTPTVFRRDVRAIWILREAKMSYLRPAFLGRPLHLSAEIVDATEPTRQVTVRATALDGDGKLLTEGFFTVVPLIRKRFMRVAGLDEIPVELEQILGPPDVG